MTKRIAVCTAGGAIAPFHAAFKAIDDGLAQHGAGDYELVGAINGLSGLIHGRFAPITAAHIEVDRAGSMVGADREKADAAAIGCSLEKHGIHAVIMMGGDNHLGEAAKCAAAGINIVGYPKTMDGDLSSFITLGWETAVTVGAQAVRMHHHTSMTYERVFFVGLFGRDTDWTTAAISAYGGGDLAIPCEAEYDWEQILEGITAARAANRERYGRAFAMVPYSEGARIRGVNPPPPEHQVLDKHGQCKLQPEWLGLELTRLARKAKVPSAYQAHTYDMRDHPPTQTDKRLSAMAGAACIDLILQGRFGEAVVFKPQGDFFTTGTASLAEVARKRSLRDTGYFDYDRLQTTPAFVRDYGNLFRASLGEPPRKDDLVYANMRPAAHQQRQ